jgi:hypothetical protein
MQDSHTPVPADETTDPDQLRLVGTATLGLAERLAGRLDGHLARFAEHMREGLLAASTAVGLDVMAELMAAEVTDLAGPKGKHNPARVAKRHGGQDGTVTLGGRRVPVRRPRVRTVGDDEYELSLESYATFTSADLLADGVVARMLGGLSTRGYPVGLNPSAPGSSRPRRAPHARRSRAGSSRRPPSGSTNCCTDRWTSSGGWWCSWTASGWASICWSARSG